MKYLRIDLDGDFEEIASENEFVLTSKFGVKNNVNVFELNYSLLDASPMTAEAINQFFDQLPKETLSYRNIYYMRVFRPIHAIICQIESIVKRHDIDTIVLSGGSDVKFMTLVGGEGEGRHIMFQRSWLINPCLDDYFNGELQVQWKKKRSRLRFLVLHKVREFFLNLKILIQYVKSVRAKEYINDISLKGSKNIFAFLNLNLQYNHIKNIFTEEQKEKLIIVAPSIANLLVKKDISFRVHWKDISGAYQEFNKVKRSIKTKKLIYIINGKKISIHTEIFFRSLRYDFIQQKSRLSSVKRILRDHVNKDTIFLTNMTFGEDILLVHALSNSLNVSHYNFQAVAMSKMLLPQMKLADKYYLYSIQTYKLYQEFEKSYHYYLPDFPRIKKDAELKTEGVIRVGIFTQPDTYTDRYLLFLDELIEKLNHWEMNLEFILKPHYRQNKLQEFLMKVKDIESITIVDKTVSPEDVISSCDFTISMTSSILFETIQLNCPGIIISFFDEDKAFIKASCFPEVNYEVKDFEDLEEIFGKPLEFKRKFLKRKDDYKGKYAGEDISKIF